MSNTKPQAHDRENESEVEMTILRNPGAQPTLVINDKIIPPKSEATNTENER